MEFSIQLSTLPVLPLYYGQIFISTRNKHKSNSEWLRRTEAKRVEEVNIKRDGGRISTNKMECSGTEKTQVSVVKDKLNYEAYKYKVLGGDTKYKEK